MWTIAVVNEKGGTGKTTTAVNLAAAMGRLGRSVLLVDLDGQAASSRWLGVEDDNRLADALLAGEGLAPIADLLPGVSLAPATGKLDSVAHDLRPTQGGQLRKVLGKLADRYEFALIDCPPSLGNRLIGNALLASTHVIVPVETSILALDGLKILLTTLEDVREGFGHEIALAGVLACRFDGRTRLSRLVLDELRRALPGKVFRTVIRENVRMRECPASGQSIMAFAPDSHAAEDYAALAAEVLELFSGDAAMPSAVDALRTDLSGGQFDLDNLRQNAAASVREAARRSQHGKAAEPPMHGGAWRLDETDMPSEGDWRELAEHGAELRQARMSMEAAEAPPAEPADAAEPPCASDGPVAAEAAPAGTPQPQAGAETIAAVTPEAAEAADEVAAVAGGDAPAPAPPPTIEKMPAWLKLIMDSDSPAAEEAPAPPPRPAEGPRQAGPEPIVTADDGPREVRPSEVAPDSPVESHALSWPREREDATPTGQAPQVPSRHGPGAETQAPRAPAGSPAEKYPALRAMLEQMKSKRAGAAAAADEDGAARGLLGRLLRR